MTSAIGTADLDIFLRNPDSQEAKEECKKVAESLILTGALIIRDSRASPTTNSTFLSLLEDYFSQSTSILQKDERPELGYQVGVTLPNTEKPSCKSNAKCLDVIASLEEEERPIDVLGHEADPKSRFFWRISSDKTVSSEKKKREVELKLAEETGKGFQILNAPNVVPQAFNEVWEERMNGWGGMMKDAVKGVAEMLAVGLGLERTCFLRASENGSHLLAPTATDLREYGQLNRVFAGFHSDMNFLTIHGKSRYPGLHIWARNNGKKLQVKVPEGCLLVQAGQQLEWMSGGLIKAGYHEVVCTQETLNTMARMKVEHPDRPPIRISSTFFYHLSSDYDLAPLPPLADEAEKRFGTQDQYGAMKVGDQVKRALGSIALMVME